MKGTIYNYEKQSIIVEHVDNITMEEGHIEFFDIYANCKDIALDDFVGFKFDRKREVMVATKQKGGLPRHHWFPNAYLLSFNRASGNMILNYINNEGEDDYFPFNPNELAEIVFEDEGHPEYDYELLIHYLNGETDEYYKRTAGKRWDSEAQTKEEALEEMKRIDPDTFDEMAKCENVDYYEVTEVKYKIIGNEVVENMDDETVTFDTYAEAFDQIKEWKKLDKHEGWDDEYRIIEVIA